MLKAHSHWRKFVMYKLDEMKQDFGCDIEGLMRRNLILQDIPFGSKFLSAGFFFWLCLPSGWKFLFTDIPPGWTIPQFD